MEFDTWFRTWLKQHPLKEPEHPDPTRYTAEVMTRVRRLASVPRRRAAVLTTLAQWCWSRAGLAAATLAAVVVMLAGLQHQLTQPLAKQTVHQPRMVARVDPSAKVPSRFVGLEEPTDQPSLDRELDAVTGTGEQADPFVLATASSDSRWIEGTLTLFEQLDQLEPLEDPAIWGAVDDSASASLLQELQWNDEQEIVS